MSLLSSRKVKDARSFTTGGRAGSWMVCGAILGTLVGGQSTIGTAQLAFSFGLSAWWFTIGAARTSTYYALAPFIGAVLSFLLLGEALTPLFLLAATIMAFGCWLAAQSK